MVLVMHDELVDLQRRSITIDGAERAVYAAGDGPAVIVTTRLRGARA